MLGLFNRRVVQNPLCPLCKEFLESAEHVLFLYPWTIGRTVGVNSNSHSWVYTVASFICWEIWKSRCNCIFHGSVPSPEYTAEKASRAAAEFFTITGSQGDPTLQTEAKAALLAVRSVLDSNFSDVVFESDSKELIGSLNNDFKKANWTIFPLLIQIRNLSIQFRSIYWRWVPRQVNSAADWVASHCKRGMCSDVWLRLWRSADWTLAPLLCRALSSPSLNSKEIQGVLEMLDCYADGSEQVINWEKSSLFFGANCSTWQRKTIGQCTNIQDRDVFGKYLGLLADFGHSKRA
ncbi:hypothetical protein ACFX1X_038443 [Malus domestica]